MKRLILLLIILPLTLHLSLSQTVDVTGTTNNIEIGIQYYYTAQFFAPTLPNGQTIKINQVRWQAQWIGENLGLIGGQINEQNSNDVYVQPMMNQFISIVPIKWGDFWGINHDVVRVTFYYQIIDSDGNTISSDEVFDEININSIKIICAPFIQAPSIYKCCTTPVIISASDFCSANNFTWQVIGATITSGNNTSSISILPSTSNIITIKCIVRRTLAVPLYSRSTTIVINRPDPPIPTVNASNYHFCIGQPQIVGLSGASSCGLTNVQWSYPSYLTVTGQGNTTITVTANSNAPIGSVALISATLIYEGGCFVTTMEKSFAIYIDAPPPIPIGNVYLVPDNPDDLCNTDWLVKFNALNPYINGLTIVSPGIMLNKRKIPMLVTICYYNPCNNTQSCIYQWIDPPLPCNDDFPGHGLISKNEEKKMILEGSNGVNKIPTSFALDSEFKSDLKLKIVPNPIENYFNIQFSIPSTGDYILYDLSGKIQQKQHFKDALKISVILHNSTPGAIYLLKILTSKKTYSEKIIVRQ